MKRKIILCALLVVVANGASAVWASGGMTGGKTVGEMDCHCRNVEWRMPPPPLSPEEHFERLACQLKLTSEQTTSIKELFEKDRAATAPLLLKLEASRMQLREAERAAQFDESIIRAIAGRQAQTEVELTVARVRLRTQVNALLTAEQRVHAEKLMPPLQRGHGRRPPRDDGRGPECAAPPPCGNQENHHGDDDGEL